MKNIKNILLVVTTTLAIFFFILMNIQKGYAEESLQMVMTQEELARTSAEEDHQTIRRLEQELEDCRSK